MIAHPPRRFGAVEKGCADLSDDFMALFEFEMAVVEMRPALVVAVEIAGFFHPLGQANIAARFQIAVDPAGRATPWANRKCKRARR